MKNLYIPGMQADPEQFNKIKKMFHGQGMQLNGLLEDYRIYSSMSKKDLFYVLERKFHLIRNGQKVNLICHSMGCNFGVILGQHSSVNKIVFISPEFRVASRKERKQIKKETDLKYQDEVLEMSSNYSLKEKLDLYRLFLISRKRAVKSLDQLSKPVMVVYSNRDPYVSRVGIEEIVSKTVAQKVVVDSSNHNPFMSEEGVELVKKIRHFIKD